jgi:hypothetical protein
MFKDIREEDEKSDSCNDEHFAGLEIGSGDESRAPKQKKGRVCSDDDDDLDEQELAKV